MRGVMYRKHAMCHRIGAPCYWYGETVCPSCGMDGVSVVDFDSEWRSQASRTDALEELARRGPRPGLYDSWCNQGSPDAGYTRGPALVVPRGVWSGG